MKFFKFRKKIITCLLPICFIVTTHIFTFSTLNPSSLEKVSCCSECDVPEHIHDLEDPY